MKESIKQSWFEAWFNSPYWPILYSNRDDNEAQLFLDKLLKYLKPKPNSTMLDLGCGTGRHAKYLSENGFDVSGIDISEKNIAEAKLNESDSLSFFVHDMRNLFRINYYNYIFNFFTSFGYFEHHRENLKVLSAVNKGLKPNGKVVIDFMNSEYVINNLVPEEIKEIKNIEFELKRYLQNNAIIKEITFKAEGKQYNYAERVQALTLEDFNFLLKKTGFKIIDIFGDYQLSSFEVEKSNRLIIVAQKL